MPNHIKNVLKIKNLTPTDIAMVLTLIARPLEEDEYHGRKDAPDFVIDFDKIIPEPRTIEDCSPEFIIPEEKRAKPGLEITDDRHWFNWYDWRVHFWGTKWRAYDAYTKIGKSYIVFVFNTAWSYPEPIIDKLHLLGYELEYRYADEAIGTNCGRMTYSSEQGWDIQTDDTHSLPNPITFARRLWDTY